MGIVEDRILELRKKKKAALTPGGRDAAKKQHERGKLTARERPDLHMDPGPFGETDPFVVDRPHDFATDTNPPAGDRATQRRQCRTPFPRHVTAAL